jgi:hypothetical protein
MRREGWGHSSHGRWQKLEDNLSEEENGIGTVGKKFFF